jgi:hypothetical protein
MRSFLDQGHSFHLYTYSSELEVPFGVVLRNAADLFEQSEFFTYKTGRGAGSPAAFANLFRYKLLAECGGWWVDTDIICLSHEIPQLDDFFAFESGNIINNAILLFPAKDPLMINCLMEALRIGDNASWGEAGPRLLTRKANDAGRLSRAKPQAICYPIHHSEALDLLRPDRCNSVKERSRNSLFLHIWNEVFRRTKVSKVMLPPRGSWLRDIADRHPVEGWRGEYDTEALEHTLFLENEIQRIRKELGRLKQRQQMEIAALVRKKKFFARLLAARSALAGLGRFFGLRTS